MGGFEVDYQVILGRLMHRQIGGLFALEDTVDVAGRLPILCDEISPVRADMEWTPRLDDGEGVHSGLTLAALMMGHHFSISAF